ncbi:MULTISPECIES: polysaccharide pyruvyl transferase family protein [unclassified Rhizobium]|uniref:polysaccharide pyruvyl transferase family protein n=1 Tax=unclassified Rhizobium TaxID=2613769 RepID=UPI001ADA39F8|nr:MULTISPECIES: polysaccharide pyruvyl transferase family protein [unclassified Rhizobium]MBO9127513.1 polysaccharide pyruvyl transferase family protein [Rhizobium sp. 16-488-2b]MBO9177956.1 polysaccharide pyruvyl transferase family protein [Rhizobium sp. 16-488-2a]
MPAAAVYNREYGHVTGQALSTEDAAQLERQRQTIRECLDRYIPESKPVAILQFPFDFNVGNHMMWVAAMDYLKQRNVSIAYTAHGLNFDLQEMIRAVGDGVILFSGGVTISRLWPRHAEIKRIVAQACPNNRLVSLPSTMLFVDDEDRLEARTIFGNHRDVVLLARDPVSAESARDVFPDNVRVEAVHDSALLLPPQQRLIAPKHDVIWLARDDIEGVGSSAPSGVEVFDWTHHDPAGMRVLFPGRFFSRIRKLAPALSPIANRHIAGSYDRFSRYMLASGNRRLDTGKVLVTDRMHPHILCTLRSQHSVLLPDRFGKNRAVYEYTSRNHSTVHWADTHGEALDIALAMARRTRV